MSLDLKALKKLAAACRKAGIKTYKSADFEITLSDDMPTTPYKLKSKKASSNTTVQNLEEVETEQLTQDQLLFYSVRLDEENDQKVAAS